MSEESRNSIQSLSYSTRFLLQMISSFSTLLLLLTIPSFTNLLHLRHKRPPIHKQSRRSEHTQPRRQKLLRLDRSREGASSQEHGRQEREFNAVGLALGDAVAAETVLGDIRQYTGVIVGREIRGTRSPTPRPAVMDGTDPVRTYPVMPPTEVRAERMYAGFSDACRLSLYQLTDFERWRVRF